MQGGGKSKGIKAMDGWKLRPVFGVFPKNSQDIMLLRLHETDNAQ